MNVSALAAQIPFASRAAKEGAGPPATAADERAGPPATTLLGLAFLGAWFLLVVDGVWIYAQVKLFGHKALPLSLFVGLLLFGATVWSTAESGRTVISASTATPFWLMTCYLLLTAMIQTGNGWTDLGPAIHGYYVYYFFLLFIPLQWQFQGIVREQTAAGALLVTGAGLAVLALAQHFTGNLFDVGRTISSEAEAFNLSMHGQTRANGLFAHSEDLGHFLALTGGLALACSLATRRLLVKAALWALFVLMAAGCYSSYTRSAYIAFAATSACALFLPYAGARSGLARFSPVLLLIAGFALFFGRSLLAGIQSEAVLLSSSSLEDRIYATGHYWNELSRAGWLAMLFGKGWILFSHPRATLPIDNNFLAIVLNIGVLGLLLWLWVTWRLWGSSLALLSKRPSPVRIALVAAFAPWLMLSVFGVVDLYQMIALLLVAVSDDDER